MPKDIAPPDIQALAEQRAVARREQDFARADTLKSDIEVAGWKVVDYASLWSLERAHAPVVEEAGRVRYGSSGQVPSRLHDAAVGTATVVILASEFPDDIARAVRALGEHAPDGTQVVIVANLPSEGQAAALDALDRTDPGAPGVVVDVVWTSARLGEAAALNAGIRRASAPVVVLMDASVEPQNDVVTPLVRALDDPHVAVAGPFGLVSADMRRFEPPEAAASPGRAGTPEGEPMDVDAIEGYLMAFRRADFTERGPLDEHFTFYRTLDVWWSLTLRDDDEGRHRHAVRVPGLSLERHVHRGWASLSDDERDRRSKKNYYRLLKYFASRRDLLSASAAGRGRP